MMTMTRSCSVGCLLGLSLVLLLAACPRSGETGSDTTRNTKEYPMPTRSHTELEPTAIPPIDAAAPPAVETATFGLG